LAANDASARTRPIRQKEKPVKTRRLKKADFDVGFFFMEMFSV
jgi:hypothetical protein